MVLPGMGKRQNIVQVRDDWASRKGRGDALHVQHIQLVLPREHRQKE